MCSIFRDTKVNELITEALNSRGTTISDLIVYLYHHQYHWVNGVVYRFGTHRWETVDVTRMISGMIDSTSLLFRKLHEHYAQFAPQYLDCFPPIFRRLHSCAYRNEFRRSICYTFNHDISFDQNLYLVGFNNGVYDLAKAKFRPGKPSDYISKTVDYDYLPTHTAHYSALLTYLADLVPDETERTELLTFVATALCHHGKYTGLLIHGGPSTGKTHFLHLINKTFGQYAITYRNTFLDPIRSRLKNIRMVCGYEDDKIEQAISLLTSDTLTSGEHPSRCETYSATHKFIGISATEPHCTNTKVCTIQFTTTFVSHPDQSLGQKQRKLLYKHKQLDLWKQDLMLILLEKCTDMIVG